MRLQDIPGTQNRSTAIHGSKGRAFCFGDRLWHTWQALTEDYAPPLQRMCSLFLSLENSASDRLLILPHNSVKSRRRWTHSSSGKQNFPFLERAPSVAVWWVLIVFPEKACPLKACASCNSYLYIAELFMPRSLPPHHHHFRRASFKHHTLPSWVVAISHVVWRHFQFIELR